MFNSALPAASSPCAFIRFPPSLCFGAASRRDKVVSAIKGIGLEEGLGTPPAPEKNRVRAGKGLCNLAENEVVVRFARVWTPRPAPTGVCRGAGVTVRVQRTESRCHRD